MRKRKLGKKALALLLSALLLEGGAGESLVFAEAVENVSTEESTDTKKDFLQQLQELYKDPDRSYQSDVRWWLGEAANTDEALLEEVQALYDEGFHGVELCMQSENNADNETYAYGSEMWAHKWKLLMNALLDHGMEVSLTSGTNWATSNVPGLDPDSQAASQVIAMGSEVLKPGEKIEKLPEPDTERESNAGKFEGAYAMKIVEKEDKIIENHNAYAADVSYTSYTVDPDSIQDLAESTEITQGDTVYVQNCDWTAPEDGSYLVVAYYSHGNYVAASPSAEKCYATNYFDERGVEALKEFWQTHYLDDPELNEKIKEGDVQLFMDSIELTPDGGITWWTETIREEFEKRKGYDVMPYLFLVQGLPQVLSVYNPYYPPAQGYNDLADQAELREKIINDWVDVLTQLYCENMLQPLKEWLNDVGIKTRAQISYGRSFEITEPSMYVDYPEAENFNQYDQVDVLRLHTAGGKLQNKVVSAETGAELPSYGSSMQSRLTDAYSEYAAGIQRVIWHIWSSAYTYGEEAKWPCWGVGYDRWGSWEIDSRDMDEFNAHIGRIQTLLQTGKSRTDIGFIHNNWNQGMLFGGGTGNEITGMNFEQAHMGVYYRSTELQDNGYTYDYLSPRLLNADGVSFDEETATIEPAGYKAVVLYQDWLDADGAQQILDWAKKGLKVVVLENAAKMTPFNDGKDEQLQKIMEELLSLDTVKTAEIYDASDDFSYFDEAAEGYSDGVLAALQELGVEPYNGYAEANHQLLTQTREDEDGNRYLYLYNYCGNDYHENSYIESVKDEDHGTTIQTQVEAERMFVPYKIDPWSGEITKIGEYCYENGKTVFSVDLDYQDIALYALEAVKEEELHAVDSNADFVYQKDEKLNLRSYESKTLEADFSNGEQFEKEVSVPEAYDITGWTLNVEAWTAGEDTKVISEVIDGVETKNAQVETKKENIEVSLDKLMTWDQIPEIGPEISGTGHYEATFNWDASAASGAVLDLGDDFVSAVKIWINGQKVGGDISENPTKIKTSIAENCEGTDQYTGGISWKKPIADIGNYLVDGENTIVMEYSSNMTNVALTLGIARESENYMGWWKNDTKQQSYGPSQAVIIPYVDTEMEIK